MADKLTTASLDRELWVDCQLTQIFLKNATSTTLGFVVALPVTYAMLYGNVSHFLLGLWALMALALIVYRYRSAVVVGRIAWDKDPHQFLLQFDRHAVFWPATSALWAGLLFLYLEKVPLENQFICSVILIGMGSFSVLLMAARLDIFKRYIDALTGVSAVAIIFHAVFDVQATTRLHDVAFLVLVVVFWRLLHRTGARFHAVIRQGFGLQFDNEKLITSLRQQSSSAFDAIEAKDRLLANAAHDLRQPIHALAFYAELLRSDPRSSAEVMPKILTATDSVNTLFNSLFDFAKLESSGVQVNKIVVPVCEIINQVAVQFAPAAHAKQLDFREHIAPAYVLTDPLLMQRVLGNLLANAIRYTSQGGVLLCSRVRRNCLWIEVWDTGSGIAPEHLPYVFREFYKVPTQGTGEGFGLGLAIVQRLCDALGHKVYVRSRLGRGTRVRIELPMA